MALSYYRTIVIAISLTCNILTIATYLYVKKLRNTLGKCVISSLLANFMWQSLGLIQMWLSVPHSFNKVPFVFFFAHNFWLSVMSYHSWRTFKSVNGEEPRFLFLAYNVYVWVPTAILPGGTAFIYLFYGELIKIAAKFFLCTFLALLISSAFTLIMFILTIIHILKVKRRAMKLTHRDEETMTCLNLDSETYLYCLRILFVMGLTWTPFIISYVRNTLRLLEDSIRGRPKKQFVRAQRVQIRA
nr:probable G-protein coupled receptor Mth-like 7 isoform X2 [Drosophila suzukii]